MLKLINALGSLLGKWLWMGQPLLLPPSLQVLNLLFLQFYALSSFTCPLILFQRGAVMLSMGMFGMMSAKILGSIAAAMAMLILLFVALWIFDLHNILYVKTISRNAGDSAALAAASAPFLPTRVYSVLRAVRDWSERRKGLRAAS